MKKRRRTVAWKCPPRPTKLSDPHCEFLHRRLNRLVATDDDDLDAQDFADLFRPASAGTFDEVAYFLPLVFEFMQEGVELFDGDLLGFTSWLRMHHVDLARIKATRTVEAELHRTLDAWTRTFKVNHYDADACYARYRVGPYEDEVEGSESVYDLVSDLVDLRVHAHVAETFLSEAATSDSPVQAAWFLEIVRAEASWGHEGLIHRAGRPRSDERDYRRDVQEAERYEAACKDPVVRSLIREGRERLAVPNGEAARILLHPEMRRRALQTVRGSELFDETATYWQDMLTLLERDS